jgi:RNA polymerase sigma-70 factor (ECF subfamily)
MVWRQESINERSQDWHAFDKRFRRALLAYFGRRMPNHTEAEDLTQEVFVRLTRRPDQNEGENIEAYVFRIAASVLTDWNRREHTHMSKSHKTLSDSTDDSKFPGNLIETRTPERILIGKGDLKDIEDALASLKQKTRDIFLLSKLDQLSHRDIAELYDLSVSAVEKHVMNAMAHVCRKTFRK